MNCLVVAIDGPAGAGKSTVARGVASRLGIVHIETGATYRLVALQALEQGVPVDDPAALRLLAERVAAACDLGPGGTLRHEGREVGEEIRTPEVTEAASVVARHPEVRRVLVALQRRLVPPQGAVIEGRDVGTVVWPDARVKVYLDAREEARAARRSQELGSAGEDTHEAVRQRDERDATRASSPMRPAEDAVVIDTTDRTPEEVAEAILTRLRAGASSTVAPPPGLLYRVVRGILAAIMRSFFRLRVEGRERIPASGPAILAPNHRSLVDIPTLAAVTKRKVWLMGKEELFRSKPMARVFMALGAFPVRRGRPDRRALTTALDLLRHGELLGVFPEGTRTPDARFEQLEDGLAYLAMKSGAPIVPMAFSGTEAVLPKDQRLPKPVTIRVLVGEPFTVGGPVEGVVARSAVRQGTELAKRRLVALIDRLEPRP